MTAFSIAVYAPTSATTRVPVLVPASLDVRPRTWSAVAKGGMWDAEIAMHGPLTELTGLTAWLGYMVEIVNERGTVVWWGDVETIEITSGGLRKGISLDRMANRVMLRYTQIKAGGGVESTDTTWSDNTLSQATFGIWERRITPQNEMATGAATAMRATALNVLSVPHYTLSPDAGEQQARLLCTGYWQRNKRTYHSELRGLEEHNTSGTAYPLGLGIAAETKFAFSSRASSISNIDGHFINFDSDMHVKITGASVGGNNTTYTIQSADGRDAVTYTSTNVTFTGADDIADSVGGLAFIENDDVFEISGTNSNNGTWILDKAGSVNIEVNGGFHGGAVTNESAGDTVVFKRGNFIEVTPAPSNEVVGNSVTVSTWGQRYYQTFTLSVDAGLWTVDTVEVRLRRIGGPADNVKVQLYTDNAGAPNTLLKEATVAADDIPIDMDWVAFDLDNAQSLTYGTVYGIVVSRTGANDWDDFYEIDLDEGATYTGGTCVAYDGAAYQTMSPTCDMIFRVLGGVDTGTQAGNVLQAQSWAATVDAAASGVVSNQYRDGELTAFDELESLLDTGTSGGTRLCARTTQGRGAVIFTKPGTSTARFAWHDGNRLTDLFGQDAEPGYLPAGEWVQLGDVATLGPWSALSPVFVERAEYSVGSGWSLEPENAADPFDTGTEQG